MARQAFSFADLERDCDVDIGCHRLDGRTLGTRISVPEDLKREYPYNASAYTLLQELRPAINEYGLIEFPSLPVNPTNYTVAMRHPVEHDYSDNPYLTRFCQEPHQDTPPYPTAFWLGEKRRFSATWVISLTGLHAFQTAMAQHPKLDTEALHRLLVKESLDKGTGLLVNSEPGLLLIDNGPKQSLYHARTCNFAALEAAPNLDQDTPLYAFNEPGLLHYIDSLDSRRGNAHRDANDQREVEEFLASEAAGASL